MGFFTNLFQCNKKSPLGYKVIGTAQYKTLKNATFMYENMIFVKMGGSGKMISDMSISFSDFVRKFPDTANLKAADIGELEVSVIKIS